jgi:hypothetical protein
MVLNVKAKSDRRAPREQFVHPLGGLSAEATDSCAGTVEFGRVDAN